MNEKEIELIIKHRELEEQIWELEIGTHYAEGEKLNNAKEQLVKSNSIKNGLEKKLINLTDSPITRYKIENVKTVLKLIISNLEIKNHGASISKSQGMIIDNWLFGKIIYDLKSTFDIDYEGRYPIPQYFFSVGENFNPTELIELLKEMDSKLEVSNFKNYIELKNFVENYFEKIRILS